MTFGPRDAANSPFEQNGHDGVKPAIKRKALADERALTAYKLRVERGLGYAQIGEELGISAQGAKDAYDRGRLMLIPTEEVEAAKETALEKLDRYEQMALDVYHQEHVLVNFGKVVHGVQDYGPKLQAIDRLLKIAHERRNIIGYTAPSKRVVEVITEDALDKAIRELNEQAQQLEREAARVEFADMPVLGDGSE